MSVELKLLLVWVAAAFSFIALIVSLWVWNATRAQNNLTYGEPTNNGTLVSPRTPLIVAESHPSNDVASLAQGIPEAVRFAALLKSTGVEQELGSLASYTIFVPTDRAIRLQAAELNGMSTNELKRFVRYHVVAGRAVDVNAVDSGTIQALSKDALNFSVQSGDESARVNSATVLQAYKGKNGVVYVINEALLPPIMQ